MGKFNNEENDRGRGDKGQRGGRGGKPGFGRGPPRRVAPKVYVQTHRLPGVFIARGPQEALVTKNLVPGESVYNEKRVSVEVGGEKV